MVRVASLLLSLSLVLALWLSVKSTEALVTWPEGTYGLPKAKTGCPVSPKTEWTTGWLYEDTEDNNPGNQKSRSFHLDATVALDINRTFCMKVKNEVTTDWPAGQYCIFKKEDCPKGFREGSIFWDDENDKNINKNGGTLPDGVYNRDTLIFYCCRTDGDKLKPVPLPVISPFYLKPFNSPECQRVEGAVATEEFIRFDNEDSANKDTQNGSFPYGAGKSNHKLSYCYYENCDYTYSLNNNAQIEFSSPNFRRDGYPLAQKCTWRFVAPETEKIYISFLEVEIEEGDVINIKDGWKSGQVNTTIQKSKPPNPDGYRSQSNLLFVEFQSVSNSSSRKKLKGFRAIFTDSTSKKLPSSAFEWPSGTFGLPRTSLGCPYSDNITWSTGWRFQDTEDNSPNNYRSYSFHMDALVMRNDVNRSFCIATKNDGTKKWPKGQYCIYKKGACPEGFTEGFIFFDDENHKNQNKMGGVVPDGVYNKDTKIFYCCRADGNTTDTISLPTIVPFYLMAFNISECQQVRGAVVTKEFIRYDNEDQGFKDELVGTHAYAIGNLIIGYCYYEACHYTISEKSQAFSSPNYHDDRYPNSQVCTWRFLVQKKSPQNEQILIKFPKFDLQKGKDGDVVRIYSGWDDKAPLLAEFNGDNPPPDEGVASGTPVVFLVFSSDSRRQSRGFQGLFVNQAFDLSEVPKQPIPLPGTKTTTLTPTLTSPSTRPANKSLNVSTQLPTKEVTTDSEPPTAAKGKQTGTQSSSSPAKVIVPVLLVVILVAALIGVYYIRRRRNEARIRKAIHRSQSRLVDNGDLNSQEYDSNEELQEIFPLG